MREGERLKGVCKGGKGRVRMRVRHRAAAVKSEGTPVETEVANTLETSAEYDGCRGGGHVVGTCGDRGCARDERVGCYARGPRVMKWCSKWRGKGVGHVGLNRGQLFIERWLDAAVMTGGTGGNHCDKRAVTLAVRHLWPMLVAAGNSGVVQMVATCGGTRVRSAGDRAVHSVWRSVSQCWQPGWSDAGTVGRKTGGTLSGMPRVIPVPTGGVNRRGIRVWSKRGYSMCSRGALVRAAAGSP